MDRRDFYDYELPAELIASQPLERRDASRMLVVDRRTGAIHHRAVRDLPEILRPHDCLVLNDTQVLPARLFGTRVGTGGRWEGLFLRSLPGGEWSLIGHAGGKMRPGDQIEVARAHGSPSDERLTLTLLSHDSDGVWTVRPSTTEEPAAVLQRFGTVPLPPYVKRKLGSDVDWERYQTAFARRPGAVAAPTAGLHFTPALLEDCSKRGIERAFVTLHVGIGTFRPIAVDLLSEHVMHHEWCQITEDASLRIERARSGGGRIVAVGTTSVRTLETASRSGRLEAFTGETNLFIRPPYAFRTVDALLTNFHLPRSTLLVLVAAFAGMDLVRKAYEAAIAARYRFYSYGDSMLIL